MGLAIKKLKPAKSTSRKWKLQKIHYLAHSKKTEDVHLSEYGIYGINPAMTFEQASKQKDALNEKIRNDSREEKNVRIAEKLSKQEKEHLKYFDPLLHEQFYREEIFMRFGRADPERIKRNRIRGSWNTAKDIIIEVGLKNPRDWYRKRHIFYNTFTKRTLALSYVEKILPFINAWGEFQCDTDGTVFKKIPFPTGMDAAVIKNTNFDARKTRKSGGKASLPLHHDVLAKNESNFSAEAFNWLYISVWFGLRAHEINGLKDKNKWKVTYNKKHKLRVLHVYQPKLILLPHEHRWKLIPLIYPEQARALQMIKKGRFKTPTPKTIQKYCGEGITLNGGRKAFQGMMRERGHDGMSISRWLGHESMNRTYKDYMQRDQVQI